MELDRGRDSERRMLANRRAVKAHKSILPISPDSYSPLSKEEIMQAADRVTDLLETITDEQLVKELAQLKDGAIARALHGGENNDA